MVESCLVKQKDYDFGCLAPAILIIAALSFMNKRVRLKPECCNGRPALPIPVDFLGDDKNRFTIAFAFGVTAASSFNMFLNIDPVSKALKNNAWSKAFRGVFMALVYGILNYPYFACLKTEYKIIGYSMGLIYSFVRLVVNLFLYFGCTYDKQLKMELKSMNLGYVLHLDNLVNIPVVVCTFFLVGSYSVLLYRRIKQTFTQDLTRFRDVFEREELKEDDLAKETDINHVLLLFSNRLHEKRVLGIVPWYISLKNKLYQTRTDFKFSTQFLSAYLVSWIFVYQVTVYVLAYTDVLMNVMRTISKNASEYILIIRVINGYLTFSTVIAMIFAALQLCFFMRSHRSDVLKTYRTRKGLLPDEILHPKMLVGKSLRFCGYQIAFTGLGLLVSFLAIFLLLFPIWFLHLLSIYQTSDQILSLIWQFLLGIMPLIILPILSWITLVLLALFVFKDHNYPDFSIAINNRRLFDVMSYFFFFFNILVGIWSGLKRIMKGAALGLLFFPRLDRTMMMTGYRKWDKGYMAYIGFLNVLVAHRHPVMLCFCQMLIEETRGTSKGQIASPERPRVSTKALNRWFLAVMLSRNKSLVRYRKQGVHQGLQAPSTIDVLLEMPPIILEDAFPPLERLKSLDVY